MSYRKNLPKSFGDVEKPHETVADSIGDGPRGEALTVRLGDSWSDLVRVPDQRRAPDVPRSSSAVPLLDDMKGIRQWD